MSRRFSSDRVTLYLRVQDQAAVPCRKPAMVPATLETGDAKRDAERALNRAPVNLRSCSKLIQCSCAAQVSETLQVPPPTREKLKSLCTCENTVADLTHINDFSGFGSRKQENQNDLGPRISRRKPAIIGPKPKAFNLVRRFGGFC